MRGFTLRAVPVFVVVFACGCFLTNSGRAPESSAAPPTATHAYWKQVSAILAQKPTNSELPVLVALVRTQTDALRDLPSDGVDADLFEAVGNLIKAEDEVLRRAEMVDNSSARLKESEGLARAFAEANRTASEAKKRVKVLQSTLNLRHGGGFAPMGG